MFLIFFFLKLEVNTKETVPSKEIEDAATLLKEKVTFLTEGKDEISPVQQMAIQLEVRFFIILNICSGVKLEF